MDFPNELKDREFFKYMHKPAERTEDFFLETFLFILWILIVILIVNIFYLKNCFQNNSLQEQRYTPDKHKSKRKSSKF